MDLTLQIGASAPATLPSLGISSAVLTQSIAGEMDLAITAARDISSAPLAAPFERVVLRADNVVRFVGWLDQAPRQADGRTQACSYRFTGPHRWLSRAMRTERGGIANVGGLAVAGEVITQPLQNTIEQILAAALEVFPGAFTSQTAEVLGFPTPVERRVDTDCLTALRAALGYAPLAAVWWDFPGGDIIPRINIGLAAEAADKTLSQASYKVSTATLNPRYDLLASTVTVYFLASGTVASTDTVEATGDAAAITGINRTQIYTFDAGALYEIPGGSGRESLAESLAAWHFRLHVDAQATRESIDWSERPGQVWTFGGAFSALAGFRSTAHALAFDLFGQTSTLQLGVPPAKTAVKLGQRTDSQNAPENSGGGGGGGDEETGTVTGNIAGLPEGVDAYWQAGDQAAVNGGSVELAPGSYTVIFAPAWDSTGGRLYLAPAVTVNVTSGGTTSAFANYEAIPRLKLQPGGETDPANEIDINTEDIPPGGELVKLREYYVVVNGALKKAAFLSSQGYDV